jgi:hypothetical protein
MVPQMDENCEPLEHTMAREKAIRNEDTRGRVPEIEIVQQTPDETSVMIRPHRRQL